MKKTVSPPHSFSLSQAEKLGAITFLTAVPLFAVGSWLALIPLCFFLLPCFLAPFFPQWGFFLPIISKSITDSRAVALTFDDGPTPGSTPIILQLLKHYNFKATFFVIGKKAEKYPQLITDILEDGHSIGNHSWQHDNLLMLRSTNRLRQDIKKTQQILQKYGILPLVFRPPAGATNPRLNSILRDENIQTVTFSCRAFDYGNKKIINLAKRITSKLTPGDIILLHDLAPQDTAQTAIWKNELNILFSDLQKGSPPVQPLEVLIDSQVMKSKASITTENTQRIR